MEIKRDFYLQALLQSRHNGMLLIEKNGKLYTAQGVEVR